jgi:hypothetical protein
LGRSVVILGAGDGMMCGRCDGDGGGGERRRDAQSEKHYNRILAQVSHRRRDVMRCLLPWFGLVDSYELLSGYMESKVLQGIRMMGDERW